MKAITRITLFLLVGIALLAAPARSAEAPGNPHLWKPKVKSVTVFKNGLGFFMREGQVSLRNGWCVANAVPPASFGTLAIYSHGENEVVDVVGSGPGEVVEFDDLDSASDLATKRARLESSLHLEVQLTYSQKGRERIAAATLAAIGPEFAVLDADNNSFAVPVAGITKMQILKLPLRVHVSAEQEGESPEKTTLGMAYLRQGLTWIPEYTLRILDDDTAEMTLRGTLVNEAEDLIHCDVNFVVGVPHFIHTKLIKRNPMPTGR